MDTLRYICTIFEVCGCLRPASWTSPWKKYLYYVYAFAVWLLMHTLSLYQILDLALNVDNQEDFGDNFSITLGVFGICFKMCYILANQRNIRNLIDILQQEPFLPMNGEEVEIRTRFNNMADRKAIAYTIVVQFYITVMMVISVFTGFRKREFMYRIWLPYDYTLLFPFTMSYIQHTISILYCSFFTIACDNLFAGLMIHIYCQLEILGHRLKSIEKKNGDDSASQCAHLHDHIYKFAAMVNKEFAVILFCQILLSISTICFNLYQLTQQDLASRFLQVVLYSVNVFIQIFYYCWYGNEVKLKSIEVSDMIFASNWTSLDNNTKKILLMIMKRATVPIEMSTSHIVTMNLDTFMAVLKTSYSAFNVLQQGQR